jgi:hypothetical protein
VARQAALACPRLELRLVVGAADGDDDVLASGWESPTILPWSD